MTITIIIIAILILLFINLVKLGSIVRFKTNIKHINHIVSLFDDSEQVKFHLLFYYLYETNNYSFYKEIIRLLKSEPDYFFSLINSYVKDYYSFVHVFTTLYAIVSQKSLYSRYTEVIRNNIRLQKFEYYVKKSIKNIENNKQISNDIKEKLLSNIQNIERNFKEVIYNVKQ